MLAAVREESGGGDEETPEPSCDEDGTTSGRIVVRGVVFGRSVRSSFATLHVARLGEEEEEGKNSACRAGSVDDDDDDDEMNPS